MSNEIRITADDREAGAGVIAALRQAEDVEVTVRRLKRGDYRVADRRGADRLLFERKTLPDLAVSIRDGRLFRQAVRLRQGSERGVHPRRTSSRTFGALILEGTGRDLAGSRMRREAIQGALVSVALFIGLPILRARTPAETGRLICYAARQHYRLADGALPRSAPARRPKKKRRAQLYLLQGLPGVGPARAERLLNAFGSVEAVMQASVEELEAVSGVGSGTAEKIRWAVGERAAQYVAESEAEARASQGARRR